MKKKGTVVRIGVSVKKSKTNGRYVRKGEHEAANEIEYDKEEDTGTERVEQLRNA